MFKAFFKVLFVTAFSLYIDPAFAQTGYQPEVKREKQFPANPTAVGQAALGTSILVTPANQLLVNYSTSSGDGYILRLTRDLNVLNESAREGILTGAYSRTFANRNQVSRNPDSTLVFAGSGKSPINPLADDHAIVLRKLTYNTLAGNQEAYVDIPGSDAAVVVCSFPDTPPGCRQVCCR